MNAIFGVKYAFVENIHLHKVTVALYTLPPLYIEYVL